MSNVKPARQKVIIENLAESMGSQFPDFAELPAPILLRLMQMAANNKEQFHALGTYARRNKQAVKRELTVEDVEEAGKQIITRKVLSE